MCVCFALAKIILCVGVQNQSSKFSFQEEFNKQRKNMLTRKPLRGILWHICPSGPQALTHSNKNLLKHAQLSLFDESGIFCFFLLKNQRNSTDTGNKHIDGNYDMSEKYITPLGSVRSRQHSHKILTTHNKISQKVTG